LLDKQALHVLNGTAGGQRVDQIAKLDICSCGSWLFGHTWV